MSTSAPHGSQNSSGISFDRLPLEIRHRIYDKLLPEAIIFQVTQRGRHSQWPRNPLADLAMCLPHFQNELNIRLYSSTRFIFYDSSHRQNRRLRTYGYETAAKFFYRIGPQNLGYIKQVYCHFHWIESSTTLPHLFKLLSLMASTDPPRKIKNLHLRFTKTNRVIPFQGARLISRRSFVLDGFPGLIMILIFPNSKDQVKEADLNAGIAQFRDPGPPVNFLKVLPAELRNKIFQYVIPRVYQCEPTSPIFGGVAPGWVVVNRQMNAEICWLLYGDCRFEFYIPSLLSRGQPDDPGLTFRLFLEGIGGKNASRIRLITICFEISPYIWTPVRIPDLPRLALLLEKINSRCAFQIDTSSIPDPFVSRADEYQFRIPTRVSTTLIVVMRLGQPVLSPPKPHKTLESWAASVLKTSFLAS